MDIGMVQLFDRMDIGIAQLLGGSDIYGDLNYLYPFSLRGDRTSCCVVGDE